ncbi:hypothetical protein B4135_0325 [Caldibacillus debilis]|uniref:Uncharacterized protein n=1 Tax=Caldibacillus debilis TaxID=301148 RepID=A0A150M4Y0_9BACI|nr:hypothetical protein B4135_0325 [Caldibacillus debilis]
MKDKENCDIIHIKSYILHTLDLPIQYIIFLNVFTRSEPGPLRAGAAGFF